jgi:NADH dehydrogenase FAD-containing subunit
MRKHLVLVGGGHAHMMTLEYIGRFVKKGYKVTVIGPSFFHYYSGMGPGMLGGTYRPDDIRFATQDVVQKQGGIFIKDKVEKIDPDKKEIYTKTGHTFSYDVVSFNAGSYVPMQADFADSSNIYSVKPIEKLMEAADKLKALFVQKKILVSIVGGGPSSAEVAGNVWQLARKVNRHLPDIRIFAGKKFMARFPETIRSRVVSSLQKRGIQIIETGYVKKVKPDQICLESGRIFPADFIFMALGVKPSTIFEASGLPVGPDKGLLVNQYLQSVKYPDIFGGGDCIYFKDQPLDKVGVYAVRENPVLLHNILASLEGRSLEIFDPGPEYLLIFNVGGGLGVLKKKGLVFGGKIAFKIKDYIDRKFMKKFQAIEKKLQHHTGRYE